MAKITINLLPADLYAAQRKQRQFSKIQRLGIATILLLVFLTSTSFALNIIQNNRLKAAEGSLANVENTVSSLKSKEASLVTIKNRTSTINKILEPPSLLSSYNLVNSLIPFSISVSSINVSSKGDINLGVVVTDYASVDNFIADLINPQKNENKIKSVTVDSFTRGREGTYRVSFKILSK